MKAGEKGNELAEFVCQEILGYQDKHRDLVGVQIMVSKVMRMLAARGLYEPPKVAPAPTPKPMSDAQARAFRDTRIPFGKYGGCKVDDVCLSYLCNLADPNEWIKELRRYLASELVQGETTAIAAED